MNYKLQNNLYIMKYSDYITPYCRVLCFTIDDRILYDSGNRNKVVIDYDDEEVGLS